MLDFITRMIGALGALGVALLMFVENVFPPVPSELIMPLAGFVSARGAIGFWTVILFSGMSAPAFLLWSAPGTFGWTAALTLAGRLLGSQFERIGQFVDPVAWATLAILVAIHVVRIVRWKRSSDAR